MQLYSVIWRWMHWADLSTCHQAVSKCRLDSRLELACSYSAFNCQSTCPYCPDQLLWTFHRHRVAFKWFLPVHCYYHYRSSLYLNVFKTFMISPSNPLFSQVYQLFAHSFSFVEYVTWRCQVFSYFKCLFWGYTILGGWCD